MCVDDALIKALHLKSLAVSIAKAHSFVAAYRTATSKKEKAVGGSFKCLDAIPPV